MHSYRGNGGNEFLLKGAGIPIGQLKLRKVSESKEGERNYLIKEFRKKLVSNDISFTANWHFVHSNGLEQPLNGTKDYYFLMNHLNDIRCYIFSTISCNALRAILQVAVIGILSITT